MLPWRNPKTKIRTTLGITTGSAAPGAPVSGHMANLPTTIAPTVSPVFAVIHESTYNAVKTESKVITTTLTSHIVAGATNPVSNGPKTGDPITIIHYTIAAHAPTVAPPISKNYKLPDSVVTPLSRATLPTTVHVPGLSEKTVNPGVVH